jgi:hypothetical protein
MEIIVEFIWGKGMFLNTIIRWVLLLLADAIVFCKEKLTEYEKISR